MQSLCGPPAFFQPKHPATGREATVSKKHRHPGALMWAVPLACWLAGSSSVCAADGAAPLRDKTLVAWVTLANLQQRGGSVLTIEKPGGVFDAIVFGEIEPGKWMAGSNFFRRTQRDQKRLPAETADDRTLVQIAIAYQGRQITIYRNGAEYARYTASEQETFGPDSHVLMGLRHLEAAAPNRYFAGTIDDARIYDRALTAEQLQALRPNDASDPKPIAWWDFEGGRLHDRAGRFPVVTLVGNARIEGGHLHLGPGEAYLMASREPPRPKLAADQRTFELARSLREALASDPHRPGYHFVTPEGRCMPFDPNGAIYWKGRYHLFYIFQDSRGHNWGHVSSTDLFHWRHHPTGLVSGMFSGNCFLNKEGRPTMCYHQVGQGNALAVALDDELNTWKKLPSNPITPKTKPGDPFHGRYRSWDPFGWVENDTYYAIFGGTRPAVAKSPTMEGPWQYVGDLFAHGVEGVSLNEDVSCPDLFRIGDKDMLLCISHRLGCRYYLGQWKDEQFHPEFHAQMSWNDNTFFAPESLLDDKGRRIMWAWVMDRPKFGPPASPLWSGTMSLPRVLTLGKDGILRMNPPEEIERLRYDGRTVTDLDIPADASHTLDSIRGDSLELIIEADVRKARRFGVKVCCSPDGEEQTAVYYDAANHKLAIDPTKSNRDGDHTGLEAGPFALKPDERLTLRVFVDKSIVEVFANEGRQAVVRRIYPARRDSLGVRLFAVGGPVHVHRVAAWQMMPSNDH
ncbi:MAG: hypothetical protein D6725_08055 [Planctomycetota bacterium]|nr:MAG: hypothetical protein D6725_08055 [Planctomycetota bacterium]